MVDIWKAELLCGTSVFAEHEVDMLASGGGHCHCEVWGELRLKFFP